MTVPLIDIVVPAAGVGKRMQLSYPKQYAKLKDTTVIEHTVNSLLKFSLTHKVIIGISQEDQFFSQTTLNENAKVEVAFGGAERADTVLNCLDKVSTEYVMVHDAARPLISLEDLSKLSSCIQESDFEGAILACSVADTLKKVKNGLIECTVDRSDLYRAYTPQLFKTSLLKEALIKAKEQGLNVTDDASAMQLCGYRVKIVEGRADNFKLTTQDDLNLARIILGQDNV